MDDPVRNPYLSPGSIETNRDGGNIDDALSAHARTGQIITFALVQGVVLIGAVFLFLMWGKPANPPAGAAPAVNDLILPGAGIAVAVAGWIAALTVPSVMRRSAADRLFATGQKGRRWSTDAIPAGLLREFLGVSQSATLVGQAALEGAAVANLVLMFVDGNWIHLPLAVICVIGIALQVPTTGKLQAAIESAAE